MKNIHVLPTEKPSRLYYHLELKQLVLTNKSILRDVVSNQNIYITSNEEIKEGEWFYNPKLLDAQKLFDRRDWKKIILTTDQDLIKDGVQAIDDEFLKWFVKNPSYESVEVKSKMNHPRNVFGYEIIIPKEEPKQETLEEVSPMNDLLKDLRETKISVKESIDTIEDEFMRTQINIFVQKTLDSVIYRIENELLEIESKWQQEQDKNKYSEEEVEDLIYKVCGTVARLQGITLNGNHIDTAYKKFKKK